MFLSNNKESSEYKFIELYKKGLAAKLTKGLKDNESIWIDEKGIEKYEKE